MKQVTLNEYEKAINKVVEYINTNLYATPSIKELAEVANISGFHLHRIFKSIIGENTGEFMNRLRLEDIAHRLLMSNDTLTDIAIKTNYGTKHTLSKAFKNQFGVSPSVYRTQEKNIQSFFGKDGQKEISLYPDIRTISSKSIVYIRVIDIYGAKESFTNAWKQLGEFVRKNNLMDSDSEFIGLSFDDPAITHPTRCRFYACLTINKEVQPEGAFGVRQISGGKYAVFTHKGAYYKLKETYYNIYIRWIPESKYKLRGSMSFEKYLNSPADVAEKDLRTEIYVPISTEK